MHYILSIDLLKKRSHEVAVGPSWGPEEHKKEAPIYMDSYEEEEIQLLECKKRTLPMFPHLPKKSMLTGKDFNEILSVAFIGDPLSKKPRMGISPSKVLNPQPISTTIPCTRSLARAYHIIHIQDDPAPNTTPSTTIITEQPPSPPQPQSHLNKSTSHPKPPTRSPCGWTPLEIPKQRLELSGPNPELTE
jgi:hypothetical protein